MKASLAKDAKIAKKQKVYPGRIEQDEQNSIEQKTEMHRGMHKRLLGVLGDLGER